MLTPKGVPGFAQAFAGRPAYAGRILMQNKIMYYVYILLSLKDRKFYVGMSGDLKRRINEHKLGKVKSTRNRLPIKLVCYESYLCKEEASRREKYLKSSDGRKELRIRLFKTIK